MFHHAHLLFLCSTQVAHQNFAKHFHKKMHTNEKIRTHVYIVLNTRRTSYSPDITFIIVVHNTIERFTTSCSFKKKTAMHSAKGNIIHYTLYRIIIQICSYNADSHPPAEKGV